MNDIEHQRMVQAAVKKRFGSHKVLKARYAVKYPQQAEREYQRLTSAYMRLLKEVLKKYLPQMRDEAKTEREKSLRHDDSGDFLSFVAKLFSKMADELQDEMGRFGIYDGIERMAKLTRKLSIKEWKRAVHKTLGLELADDYYTGEMFSKMLGKWVEQNVDLIKTIPQDSLSKMRELVLDGYRKGRPTTQIVRDIEEVYGVERRHARLIARDQIAKLNAEISRVQQTDAGVTEYIWSTSGDSRVRDGHAALDNKRFKWSDPPVVDAKTGRRCHPGEDYQCRCVALAVFDFDTIDLPINGVGGE